MSVRFDVQAELIPGYRLLDRLGSGGFGEVWKCEAPGGIFKAVKIIHGDMRSNDADLVRYAEQELKALKRVKQVRHPYLLALDRYDIVDGRLTIVMELADCNLWDRFRDYRDKGLQGIPRDELLQYMAESAEVLDLFNDQFQLQHLDIKPQNLFMLHNHVKVADFGQVKDLQGLMATVTGGITPVYAAPETFDGIITRFCDQYSLACVYQELLTGVRPFDGSSMSQLLMQHVNLPPNLDPSPASDRPALARALAKKPDDRWPSVAAFVRAIGSGADGSPTNARLAYSSSDIETPPRAASGEPLVGLPALNEVGDTPSRFAEPLGPVFTPAPMELSGAGPLRPALVIGLGQAGLRVLQRLRFDLAERYGPATMTPAVRTLFIDTDPEAIEDASRDRTDDKLAGLSPNDVVGAKLNRATHYHKPRFNGRNLTDGWFDPQLLHKLSRTPVTMGVRLFGRLAFLDHYRAIMAKVHAELEAACAPDAMLLTETRTGLQRRTNRPKVYVVGGLAGGTGSGMFLDLAYAVRSRLKQMGYDAPEIVGLFVLPPADSTLTPPQALGNTYAALTELNHYSRPDTVFTAHYDERHGFVKEKDAPFTRCYLLPGSASGSTLTPGTVQNARRTPTNIPSPRPCGSGGVAKPSSHAAPMPSQRTPDPTAASTVSTPHGDAADRIRLDLFEPVGRAADNVREARAAEDSAPARRLVTISAFGLASFDWPRTEVIGRAALTVGRAVLKRWATPDPKRFREVMPSLAAAQWAQLGFEPDAVTAHLHRTADLAAGGKVDEVIGVVTEPLVPRGWLARAPEPTQVSVALDRLNKVIGPPASSGKRHPTAVEEAVAKAASATGTSFALDLHNLLPVLVDDPQFRLAGTEELYRQFITNADRLIDRFIQQAVELDAKAVAGYECLTQYAHYQKGMRKPTVADLTDALRQYPRTRFQALTFRHLVTVYQTMREALGGQLADVATARQRMATIATAVPEDEPDTAPVSLRKLMPPGCETVADAVKRFVNVLTDADLNEIDRRVTSALESQAGSLLRVCLGTGGVAEAMAIVFEESRAHLDLRLGEVGLATMFAERFRTAQHAERAIEQAYQEAEPAWVGHGPWAGSEIAVLACPGGASGEALREVARRAIPIAGLPVADSRDDLTIYREWPAVPLAALPHLGPAAAAAYRALPETGQCTPHARLDVTQWLDVDAN